MVEKFIQNSLFPGTIHAAAVFYPNPTYYEFQDYHRSHPEFYDSFKNMSLNLISERLGAKISGRLIFALIRWDFKNRGVTHVKINNNYIPYYTRQFVDDYPQYYHMFDFRKMKNPANEMALKESFKN